MITRSLFSSFAGTVAYLTEQGWQQDYRAGLAWCDANGFYFHRDNERIVVFYDGSDNLWHVAPITPP